MCRYKPIGLARIIQVCVGSNLREDRESRTGHQQRGLKSKSIFVFVLVQLARTAGPRDISNAT